jgi:hypothetical protein
VKREQEIWALRAKLKEAERSKDPLRIAGVLAELGSALDDLGEPEEALGGPRGPAALARAA